MEQSSCCIHLFLVIRFVFDFTSKMLFAMVVKFLDHFYKTQEVVFLVFVSPYFLESDLYFSSPPKFLKFCFDHQLVELAYMAFSTNSKELLNIGTINSIELVSSSARVTSAKFHKGLGQTDIKRPGPIDRTPETPGSGKNL